MNKNIHTINVGGKLFDFSAPQVMGILNVTPDSFYAESRKQSDEEIALRAQQIMNEGASMIDVGAYSSRPGADDVSTEEEMKRLRNALKIIRQVTPNAIISVDTFRSDVAKMSIEEGGAHIINDISGGMLDTNMHRTVAHLGVPYILMHMQGNPQNMQIAPHYEDLLHEIFLYFSDKVRHLRELGAKDIILDPGFGFGKTLDQNYELMAHLKEFKEFDLPILIGISRKSMIYKLLGGTPQDALNGTTVLNTMALLQGANILRVHDVKAAVETVKIYDKTQENI